jgi:Periplasmic copper-binding protein (NosD)
MRRRFQPLSSSAVVTRLNTRGALTALLIVIFGVTVFSGSSGAANGGPPIAYAGPAVIDASSQLRMTTRQSGLVAVTYSFDGRPAGTATVRPFALRIDPGVVTPGAHRLRIEGVTARGVRIASRPTLVRVRLISPTITASPTRGLGRALDLLARGHATVLLEPGVYTLHDVRLGDGAHLLGLPGTILRAPAGAYSNVLFVSASNVRISNLTIDGGGQGPGDGEGIAVASGARNLRASQLNIVHIRRSGMYAYGSFFNISIQDSALTGDGVADAGALLGLHEGGSYASVIRCRIQGFRQWGVNFVQADYGRSDRGLGALALDNVVSDVDDPTRQDGTDAGGIWTGGPAASIIGNRIQRATWDGIETVGSSEGTVIADNVIGNTRTGIYIEHSTNHSLVTRNVIREIRTGINVEWRYGDVGSSDNTYRRNTIINAAKAGIFVDVGSDRNALVANLIRGTQDAIVLQGSSNNVVAHNVLCGKAGSRIFETNGLWDNGSLAVPTANQVRENHARAWC